MDVSGTGIKNLTFDCINVKQGTLASIRAFTTIANNDHDYTEATSAENQAIWVVDVLADSLDVNNGFTCLKVNVADVGANARLGALLNRGVRARCLSEALTGGPDIVALIVHDRGRLLARTRSGTLRLAEDDTGLRFDFDVPDTQLGRDTLALVERGDMGGASFAFRVPRRRVLGGTRPHPGKVELRDVSLVSAFPAYPETTSWPVRRTSGCRRRSPGAMSGCCAAIVYRKTVDGRQEDDSDSLARLIRTGPNEHQTWPDFMT